MYTESWNPSSLGSKTSRNFTETDAGPSSEDIFKYPTQRYNGPSRSHVTHLGTNSEDNIQGSNLNSTSPNYSSRTAQENYVCQNMVGCGSQNHHIPQNVPTVTPKSFHTRSFELVSQENISETSFAKFPTTQALPMDVVQEKEEQSSLETCMAESSDTHLPIPINLVEPHILRKITNEAKAEFIKILPSLSTITSQNFGGFLVGLLKKYSHHMSLDEFYNLLYHKKPPALQYTKQEVSPNETPESFYLKLKEGCLFHLIIKGFQNPENATGRGTTSSTRIWKPSVNIYEFSRTFLAIKILFSSLAKVDEPYSSRSAVARLSIYKLYYIICQKLLSKHPDSNSSASENFTLCQAQIGKLAKLVYPNIVTKRLGSRGQSKYHYIGFVLKTDLLDNDTLGLLDLKFPDLKYHFRVSNNKLRPRYKTVQCRKPHGTEDKSGFPRVPNQYSGFKSSAPKKPLQSYVEVTYTYPKMDFLPRISTAIPNTIPRHSGWAAEKMKRSIIALKAYNMDLCPFVEEFTQGFCNKYQDFLSNTLLQAMLNLQGYSASNVAYMHLYLVFLLLVFPMVLASDEEVPVVDKIQLRSSIKQCVDMLDAHSSNMNIDIIGISIFKRLLRKMIHLNELTSCNVKSPYSGQVIKEMVRDLESEANCGLQDLGGRSAYEETILQSVIISMNGYNFTLDDGISPSTSNQSIHIVTQVMTTIFNLALKATDDIRMIPENATRRGLDHVPQDVAYQVFKISSETLHMLLSSDPMSKLPIPVITFIMLHLTNSMQYASFHEFQKRDPELSKETFKTWWVFSTMFQEYISIISEVFGLSETLSH
ncbi:hypothetical protein JCM33374_g1278 [Metschnikowia sp. JCM 33374]|nr:hypothetical protein JCM33374_g1278 [Metschnikowia sp. JCM 33374]